MKDKKKTEPLFHIVKRSDMSGWKMWLIRIMAGVIALLLCAVVSTFFTHDFVGFFVGVFKGAFGTELRIWKLLKNLAVLLCIALALTPAFKMRFWNIGAEGQILFGALASTMVIIYWGGKIESNIALLAIMLVGSMAAGAVWAVIPALFKAKWNTNETLFTLMMNYIAIQLVAFFINKWATNGSGTLGELRYGHLPSVLGTQYFINIIVSVVLMVLVFIYLKFSKHGYELTVVGESENTAKYIGVNVKKTIIRTMLFSGLLCGLTGFLLVSGDAHTLTTEIVGGRGFTGILVSWLAHFNPFGMALTSFLVSFLEQGSRQIVMDYSLLNNAFEDIMTGIFFVFIVGCEFFINYKIMFNKKGKKASKKKEVKE